MIHFFIFFPETPGVVSFLLPPICVYCCYYLRREEIRSSVGVAPKKLQGTTQKKKPLLLPPPPPPPIAWVASPCEALPTTTTTLVSLFINLLPSFFLRSSPFCLEYCSGIRQTLGEVPFFILFSWKPRCFSDSAEDAPRERVSHRCCELPWIPRRGKRGEKTWGGIFQRMMCSLGGKRGRRRTRKDPVSHLFFLLFASDIS